MASSVVDLTTSSGEEEEVPSELQMVLNFPPESKPSVRFGPANPRGSGHRGRGRGFGRFQLLRCHPDNGVKARKQQFAAAVSQEIQRIGFRMLERSIPVKLEAWFFLRRPKEDFIGKNRNRGLKDVALERPTVPVKPDTDNLGKFLLDALTGLACEDDAQVVELRLFKLRDCNGLCTGRTAFRVTPTGDFPVPGFEASG